MSETITEARSRADAYFDGLAATATDDRANEAIAGGRALLSQLLVDAQQPRNNLTLAVWEQRLQAWYRSGMRRYHADAGASAEAWQTFNLVRDHILATAKGVAI